MPPGRGMLAVCAGSWAWLLTSSGESTPADSPSMPFSLPGVGSGALRQAWIGQMDPFRFEGMQQT